MVFIVAEIGINHNGDLKIANKLIDMAVDAGCDAVKFQKRTVEKVYSKETLDSARDSPWGKTTREQKLGLEFPSLAYKFLTGLEFFVLNSKILHWNPKAFNFFVKKFIVPASIGVMLGNLISSLANFSSL